MEKIRAAALTKQEIKNLANSQKIGARVRKEQFKDAVLKQQIQMMNLQLNRVLQDIRIMKREYEQLTDEIITARNTGNPRLRDLLLTAETMHGKINEYMNKLESMIGQEDFKQLLKRRKILTENINNLKRVEIMSNQRGGQL